MNNTQLFDIKDKRKQRSDRQIQRFFRKLIKVFYKGIFSIKKEVYIHIYNLLTQKGQQEVNRLSF